MFIRLFIKTIDKDKVEIVIKYLMSCINEDNIKYKDIINSISNRWLYFGEEEVMSCVTMEGCKLIHDLEMVNIFF